MLSSEDYSTGLKFLLIGGAFALTTAVAVPRDAHAAIFHFSGQRPQNIGVKYGRYLQGCPATPNCISSMEDPVCSLRKNESKSVSRLATLCTSNYSIFHLF